MTYLNLNHAHPTDVLTHAEQDMGYHLDTRMSDAYAIYSDSMKLVDELGMEREALRTQLRRELNEIDIHDLDAPRETAGLVALVGDILDGNPNAVLNLIEVDGHRPLPAAIKATGATHAQYIEAVAYLCLTGRAIPVVHTSGLFAVKSFVSQSPKEWTEDRQPLIDLLAEIRGNNDVDDADDVIDTTPAEMPHTAPLDMTDGAGPEMNEDPAPEPVLAPPVDDYDPDKPFEAYGLDDADDDIPL